jgi:Bacterial Ig-like domain
MWPITVGMGGGVITAFARAVIAVAAVLVAALSAAPAVAADRAYTKRFGVNDVGDVRIVGNTSMSCLSGTVGCSAARAGTGSSSNWNNDAWLMGYVDEDSDLTTFSSSMATLDLPAGATVLFAGLYWGGDAPATALRDEVRFDTPAIGGYQDLVATTFDTSTTTPTAYQGFYDVTSLVAAGGAGDYWVANVHGAPGETNKHAGWGLVVAYRDPASPRQNIAIFDGFQDVKAGDSHSATLTGLTTPASGTVDATLGLLAYEGDLGITGDVLAVDATTLSNALNPANNSFNSSITHRGTRLTAKQPDYVNQFSVEMDTFAADAIVPANATSATFTMTSTQDRYYPGVITYAGEAETVPPVTTIDGGPSGFTNDQTPTFAFSSNEAGSTFECRVDGGVWASCNSPETIASLGEGSHTFEVRATDVAGNVEPIPASQTIIVDTVEPETTIDSGPSGATGDATPTFGFSSSQPGSSFECRVDGGAWASCASPETTAPLSDGAHTFEVRATDPAGNVDQTPASRSFTVDTALPETTIDSGPSGPTNDQTPTFDFSADQPGSTFECRVDRGTWTSCSSGHTTTALTDGDHTFEVRAIDPAGNTDSTAAQRAFVVETAPPETTIDSGPSGATNDPTPAFDFSSDEPGTTFECRVDGGAWASCSSGYTTPALTDGAHTVEVRAIDQAGNVDPNPESLTFTVDTALPQTTIDGGPAGPTNDLTPTFDFSADQSGSTFECRVDGGAWVSCSPGHTVTALTDGAHTFEVRAIDSAGNTDATAAQRGFVVETGPPETTIDSGPSGHTGDATPTFGFSANEPGSTFECRVDGGAWVSCSSGFTTAALTDGAHTLEVRAIDQAGNVDPTPESLIFTVDTATPSTPRPPDSGQSGTKNDHTTTQSDLSSLPGSLVGEGSCQRLGAGLRIKRMKVRGIGRVRVRIRARAVVMAADPITVTVAGPRAGKRRLRSVGYTLDGQRMRGARRRPFTLAITPAKLARVGRHALTLRLKPKRGRRRTVKLGMRTFPCTTLFRAYQRRLRGGARLKLRIDARDAVAGAIFQVPRRMLPKRKARVRVGKLRVVSANSASRSWKLAFGAKRGARILARRAGAPAVTVRGTKVSVRVLPAGTGIVELFLNTNRATRPAALVRRGRSIRIRATVIGASSQRLTYTLRGRR